MASIFTKITRVSSHPENVIVIEIKIQATDLTDKRLRSNDFYVTDTETCFLECYATNDDYLVLLLQDIKRDNMLQRFFISLFDADGDCLHSKVDTPDALTESLFRNDLLTRFIRLLFIHSNSLNYPISITCHLETKNVEKSTASPSEVELQCLRKLSGDFQKILHQASGSDITLQVDGLDIKASKMILCARSPVFHQMFEHPTSESTLNVVRIEDIRAPIMEELVSFLYTGTKKDHHDFDDACDLYYAADKYEVLSLRDACKTELLNQLKVENACRMLILANHHGDESFKEEVMKFVRDNFKTIVNTESFREVVKDDADVAVLLIRFHVNLD